MQTANGNQNSKFYDLEWYFLAEYSLSEFMVDGDLEDDLMAKWLAQDIRSLGIPSEHLKAIEKVLTGFAKVAITHFNLGRIALHVYILLGKPKETVEDVDSMETLNRFNSSQTMEPIQFCDPPDTKTEGGWGYFVIKRGNDSTADSSENQLHLVDLYIYKEGE